MAPLVELESIRAKFEKQEQLQKIKVNRTFPTPPKNLIFRTKDRPVSRKRTGEGTERKLRSEGPEPSLLFGVPKKNIFEVLDLMLNLIRKCAYAQEIDVPGLVMKLRSLGTPFASYLVRFSFYIPSPQSRATALTYFIDEGLYLPVLNETMAAIGLEEGQQMELEAYDDGDAYLVHCVFEAIRDKGTHHVLKDTRYEKAFHEYVADINAH